jgi:hypothetical protein
MERTGALPQYLLAYEGIAVLPVYFWPNGCKSERAFLCRNLRKLFDARAAGGGGKDLPPKHGGLSAV